MVSLDENVGKYEKQEKSSSIHVPLVDLSKDDNEDQSTSDRGKCWLVASGLLVILL